MLSSRPGVVQQQPAYRPTTIPRRRFATGPATGNGPAAATPAILHPTATDSRSAALDACGRHRTNGNPARQQHISLSIRSLADSNEGVRLDAVTQLGHLKAHRAIDPLAATLSGDRSPAVREAAARALGLMRNPKGLPALQRAVQVDADHDVRRTAQFSIEIIQSR